MIRSFVVRWVAWLLCPALALGQASAPAKTFKVTSRIVYVDVVVRDRSGHIVRGLTEKDFRVAEDHKPQKIDFFHDHTLDAVPATASKANGNDPLSFSNVDASGESSSSVNIILFDFFNTAPQDYGYARKQMIRFLEELPPGRQTALFVLGTRLKMLQSFTGSTDRLLAAAKAMKMETSMVETTGEAQQDSDLVAALAAAGGRSPGSASGNRGAAADQMFWAHGQDEIRAADVTKTAMDQIAAAVSGYAGRKNLFWMADTFPLYGGPVLELNDASQAMVNNTMSTQDMADANKAEATAQIAIYPISLLGLDAGGMGVEASGMTGTQQMFTQRQAMHEMLNNLAETTGGRAYYGTNDFAGALARGFEDGSGYYELAYRPENRQWNGHFRNVDVKVEGHNYSLSYRRGYYALPADVIAGDPSRALETALQLDTPEETMLRLRSKVELPNGPGAAVKVNSIIDPRNVDFVTDARGRYHAHLMVTLIALPDPPPLNVPVAKSQAQPPQSSGMYVVDLDPEQFRKLLSAGMPMQQELKLAPGRYRLRLGVRDLGNQRIGTLDMPIAFGQRAGTGH